MYNPSSLSLHRQPLLCIFDAMRRIGETACAQARAVLARSPSPLELRVRTPARRLLTQRARALSQLLRSTLAQLQLTLLGARSRQLWASDRLRKPPVLRPSPRPRAPPRRRSQRSSRPARPPTRSSMRCSRCVAAPLCTSCPSCVRSACERALSWMPRPKLTTTRPRLSPALLPLVLLLRRFRPPKRRDRRAARCSRPRRSSA